jgi:transposase InsO family protein
LASLLPSFGILPAWPRANPWANPRANPWANRPRLTHWTQETQAHPPSRCAPVRAPRANAIAEQVVRTLRNDCLDHLIPLDEAHLRAVLTEYVAYYDAERPHRAVALQPPLPRAQTARGPVRGRPVLGGLHRVYERAA